MADSAFNAGSAHLKIRPKLSDRFNEELRAKLSKVRITHDVRVVPNLDGYKAKLTAAVKSINPTVKVGVTPDLTGFQAKLNTAVKGVNAPSVKVALTPDLSGFQQKLNTAVKGVNSPEVKVKLAPDLTGFQAKLNAAVRGVNAPELKVKVVPDLTGFQNRLNAAVRGVNAPSVNVRVAPDLTGFQQRLNTALAAAGGDVKVNVDVDLAAAEAKMLAFRAWAGADLNINVDVDSTAAMAQLQALLIQAITLQATLGRLNIPAGGIKGASGAMSGLASAAGPALMALLALAAVNLVPLVGQLVQAAGVLSLLPAMGAAAASALAAVVIGGNGVMDAFKAAGKASEDAGKNAEASAKKQAQAAKQVASAQRGVEDAQRSVEDAYDNAAQAAKDGARQIASAERQVQDAQKRSKGAQEDLTRARKDAKEKIEDLNLALKGSAIDEEDALIAVERAKERLRELGKDGEPVTFLDVREAQNNVRGAIQRLDEVRERNKDLRDETVDANKAGVEGSQQVVAAKEAVAEATQGEKDAQENLARTHEDVARQNEQAQRRIEDAQRGVADALTRVAEAQAAQAEAMNESSGAADKFDEAMAKLSPNAQDFVNKVREMGSAWTEVRQQIQNSLFDGLGASVQTLANTYLPTLRIGLGGIATEINEGLKGAITDLNSESTKLDWSHILENTRQAIGPFMDGLSSLAGALTNIASVGSEFLAGGAESFADTMQRFEDWSASEEGQTKIRNFMQKSIDALKQIKDLFIEVGRVVGGLFSTSEENGESMIESMTNGLKDFADWMGTPEGQARMEQFWDDAQQTAADMLELVKKAIELADKVAAITGNRFGLTNGKSGQVDENGNAVASDGETGVIGRTWFFPGVKEDSWLGGLLGGGRDDSGGEPAPQEGAVPSVGGTPFSGDLRSDLKNQLETGENQQGGSFLGDLGDPEKWGEKWNSFSNTVSTGWNEKVWPSLQGVKDKAGEIGKGFVDDVKEKAGNAWNGLKDGVSTGWDSIRGTWDTLKTEGLGGLADEFTSKITNGSVTSWKDLPGAISSGVGDIVTTHFPGLSKGLDDLKGGFERGIDAIGRLWDGLKEKLRGPINFVIREVYNNGIKKFWDAIGPKIGLGELPVVNEIPAPEVPAFNRGGTVDGVMSGYSPGVDDRIIAVGGGEAVMRPEWTRAVGKDFVDQANAAARSGGVKGAQKFMGGFSNGGIVESIIKVAQENFPGLSVSSSYRSTNDLHGQGKAVDLSNQSAGGPSTPLMQEAARFFHDNYGSRLAELIHWPLNGWQNIDEGKPFNFGEPTNSQHTDHVHVASHEPLVPMSEEEKGFFAKIAGAVGGAVSRVSSVFRNMAADLFEKPLNGLGSLIPDQFDGLGEFGQIPKKFYNTVKDKLVNFVRGKATEKDGSEGGSTPYDIGAGAEQWRDTVLKALEMTGHDASEADIVLKQIQIESSGNPNAINLDDINAQNGTPSKGLIQTIDPTFQAHRDPSLPNDPYDPLANLVAGIRYADATYGDIKNIWPKTMGYDAGGILPDDAMAFNTSGKPEAVFTHDEWKMLERFADLIGRPDFIDQLAAITGGPEEMPKDPAITANSTADPGPGNYGTGAGTAAENGYTIPGEGVAAGLASFDKLHGKPGGPGGVGATVGENGKDANGNIVDPIAHAKTIATGAFTSYGQKLPAIAKSFIGGWIPEEILSPGGMVGGLMSAGEQLFNWYRDQNAAKQTQTQTPGQSAPAGGFDPGSVISGLLGGGTKPAPIPAQYTPAPLPAVDQFVRNAPAPAQSGVGSGGDAFHFHVTNIDEAFRKFQNVQARKTAGFMPR